VPADDGVGGRSRRAREVGMRLQTKLAFLDAAHSPSWSRAFYIPVLSYQRNKFGQYAVLASPRGVLYKMYST
jgi:hypothetical protein